MQPAVMTNNLIEIFLLTYNRVGMLETAIRSVLNQTVKTKLTVVDNHSTDGTEEMIARLKNEGCAFDYIRRDENGGAGANYQTASEHFTYPYVMIYHDDDALHPQYIECALKAIKEHENVDLITSTIREFAIDDQLEQRRFDRVTYKLFDNAQRFVSYVYCANVLSKTETLHFSPVIYRREYRLGIAGRHDLYGKLDDTPAVFSAVRTGKVVQMTTPLAWIRRHAGQDTKNLATGCHLKQLINVNKCYKSYMEKASDSLAMYWWICGRHLRAGMNFSDGKYTTFKLWHEAWRQGLLKYRSFLLVAEYLVCKILHLSWNPLHDYLWHKTKIFYITVVIDLTSTPSSLT